MRVITFIPDGTAEVFTFTPEKDIEVQGVFATLGRAVVSTQPGLSIAGLFTFPAEKTLANDIWAIVEKVFIPLVFQLKSGNSLFLTLESQGPLMLFYEESPLVSAENG